MRKVTLALLISAICSIPNLAVASASTEHLRRLNAKYPYGLLGEDFDLLTDRDLIANTCQVDPAPFPSSANFPYWQCFHTKNVKLECDPEGGIHDPGKPQQVLIVLEIHDELGHQEYLSRRYIDLDDCISYRKEWRKLTRHQSHVCISGSYIHDELKSGENVRYWIFDKYKTRAGCDSYFAGACNVKTWIKEECGPP